MTSGWEEPEGASPPDNPGAARRAAILKGLEAVVCGNRVAAYGEPENSFGDIAAFWNVWLGDRIKGKISARDVAVMQDLLKTARLRANINHEDSWRDKAGYSICGGALDNE